MKAIPYISFNGNCEEAVNFYQSILGGTVSFMRYKDMPPSEDMTPDEKSLEKIMHASLTFEDGNVLYFSDAWEAYAVRIGNNITIHLVAENEQKVYEFVEKLSVGGEITMPAEKTFWGSVYGSLVDKFGVCWGIEFEIK